MCCDFVFIRFHLLAFHFNEFRTCRTQSSSISRQTVEGSLGFEQTIKTSKVDRWFGLIGNQDWYWTKGTSFIAIKSHFRCNPDCFDYERNARRLSAKNPGSHLTLKISDNQGSGTYARIEYPFAGMESLDVGSSLLQPRNLKRMQGMLFRHENLHCCLPDWPIVKFGKLAI